MHRPAVVVTGATGFIAKHCIAALLQAGHPVRGTVRSLARGEDVVRALRRSGVETAGLSFAAADLEADEGWGEAMAGARHVLHVASPFPVEQPRDADEVIRPAREGALRVLRAATAAGVERVVLTSSTVAVMYGARKPDGALYDEGDWTDVTRTDLTPYILSKTLAERAAWDYVGATPGAPELVAINPSFVQGPALDPDLSTSLEVIRFMGKGMYPLSPRIAFPICDVRDVAAAHAAAMMKPGISGRRFVVASGNLPLIELGRQMVAELPDLKSKAPKAEMPDWAVRSLALFDRRLRSVLPELGAERVVSNRALREDLGIEPRDASAAVRAAARSLRDLKVI